MANNAPQAGIRDIDITRDCIDRHLSNEAHDKLLERQGKTAAVPGTWDFDTSDTIFRAINPRHSGHGYSAPRAAQISKGSLVGVWSI